MLGKYAIFVQRFEAERVLLDVNKDTFLPDKNREKLPHLKTIVFFPLLGKGKNTHFNLHYKCLVFIIFFFLFLEWEVKMFPLPFSRGLVLYSVLPGLHTF